MQIGIPTNFLDNVASSSTSLLSELSGVLTLILGILLAFMILNMIINALRKDNDNGIIDE